jgi:inhibitor of KinA
VVKLLRSLEADPPAGLRNLHPAYASLLMQFDPGVTSHERLEAVVGERVEHLDSVELPPPAMVEIPVCYGGELGPDLANVAELHGLPPEEVIRLHSGASYTVYFLGFVPGFAYLGGLPDAIATPRLAAPRKRVEPGSVGIAGQQSGVYPFPTPGGWRLIGKTPLAVFRADRPHMSLLAIGDQVRFRPIGIEEFRALEATAR